MDTEPSDDDHWDFSDLLSFSEQNLSLHSHPDPWLANFSDLANNISTDQSEGIPEVSDWIKNSGGAPSLHTDLSYDLLDTPPIYTDDNDPNVSFYGNHSYNSVTERAPSSSNDPGVQNADVNAALDCGQWQSGGTVSLSDPCGTVVVSASHDSAELNPRPAVYQQNLQANGFVDRRAASETEISTTAPLSSFSTISTAVDDPKSVKTSVAPKRTTGSRKRKRIIDKNSEKYVKDRKANTLASRRCRAKKKALLNDLTADRDGLELKVAQLEEEVSRLKSLLNERGIEYNRGL